MPVTTLESRGIDGVAYAVPGPEQLDREFAAIAATAAEARTQGREIVVVQGLGFVGSVMAAVTANVVTASGEPRYFVIGVDQPTEGAYWKVAMVARGEAPVVSEDPLVGEYVQRAAVEWRNLHATASERAYSLADYIIVDVHLDVRGRAFESWRDVDIDLGSFTGAISAIGRQMPAEALVLVETTVPPGTTSRVVLPTLQREFEKRALATQPLVAHAYERVMPGRSYVKSIESFWRTFAAESPAAAAKARELLEAIIDVDSYPLTELAETAASEMAKVLENSYRASNIAFIHEWTVAGEAMGIDVFEVIRAVSVRQGTHDNIMRPGFGVGGYCLTKDGYLAQWGIHHLFESDVELGVTMRALEINYRMPVHTFNRLTEGLGDVAGRTVLLAGISYLNDVADTRNSPSAEFCDLVQEHGGTVLVTDPVVRFWPERPSYEQVSLEDGLGRCDAVVFAVRHRAYLECEPSRFEDLPSILVVDAMNLISDQKRADLMAFGHGVIGIGKGHWRLERS